MQKFFEVLGVICAIVLPLFNIPLIMKVIERKSSKDFSLVWIFGVWVCIILMLPSGLTSKDVVWRTFNISNFFLFTAVVIVVMKYRKS